jgi:hypothetical protein
MSVCYMPIFHVDSPDEGCKHCRPVQETGLYESSTTYNYDPLEEHVKLLSSMALSQETPKETLLSTSAKSQWVPVRTSKPNVRSARHSIIKAQYPLEPGMLSKVEPTWTGDTMYVRDHKVTRKLDTDGKEIYFIDDAAVPRLRIGEVGRIELKASLTNLFKVRPELRKETNRISRLKCASINQLLTMAYLCGLWEKAVHISEWYMSNFKTNAPISSKEEC